MEVLSLLVGGTCMVGFWLMKKWSVILYTIMTVINFTVSLVILSAIPGFFSSPYVLMVFLPFIIPLIVIGVGFSYYSKMG